MEVKKIKRDSWNWGIWDEDKKEFIKVFQTKKEAEEYLKESKKIKSSSK